MSERTTDPRPKGQPPIVTGFMAAAAVAAAAGPVIALIEGGHYLLTIGVCLIISGVVFLAALTLKRLKRRFKKTPPRVQQIVLGVIGIVFMYASRDLFPAPEADSAVLQRRSTGSRDAGTRPGIAETGLPRTGGYAIPARR